MDAAHQGVADVIGAVVAVVAGQVAPRFAASCGALITQGAEVGIVAWEGVGLMAAPQFRAASIGGAEVAIVTIKEAIPGAQSICTMVARGAGIAVVAGALQWFVETPFVRVAGICRAVIAIVAGDGGARDAVSVLTVVGEGARIAIVAGKLVVWEVAAR